MFITAFAACFPSSYIFILKPSCFLLLCFCHLFIVLLTCYITKRRPLDIIISPSPPPVTKLLPTMDKAETQLRWHNDQVINQQYISIHHHHHIITTVTYIHNLILIRTKCLVSLFIVSSSLPSRSISLTLVFLYYTITLPSSFLPPPIHHHHHHHHQYRWCDSPSFHVSHETNTPTHHAFPFSRSYTTSSRSSSNVHFIAVTVAYHVTIISFTIIRPYPSNKSTNHLFPTRR